MSEKKISELSVADSINNTDVFPIVQGNMTKKVSVGKIFEKVENGYIGDAYDPTKNYTAGEYCIKDNTLYRANANTTGPWDSTKWTATSVEDELNSIQSDVSANTSDISNLKEKETKTISTGGVSVNLTKIGKLIVLSIFASNTIQMTSGSNINIGTLPDGWKPLQQQGGSCIIKDSNWKPILGAILVRTSGAIELNQASGSTITTAQILANICYFVN